MFLEQIICQHELRMNNYLTFVNLSSFQHLLVYFQVQKLFLLTYVMHLELEQTVNSCILTFT